MPGERPLAVRAFHAALRILCSAKTSQRIPALADDLGCVPNPSYPHPMTTQIDARGPRFGAAITTAVLAVAVAVGPNAVGTVLIAWQLVSFGLGAFVGLGAQPYGLLYARFVKPRLAGPTPLEPSAPPRFAQTVGFAFALVALVGALTGQWMVYAVAASLALAAAFLNAVFAFCLGCEMYLLIQRLRSR